MLNSFVRAIAGTAVAMAVLAGAGAADSPSHTSGSATIQTDPDPAHYYVNVSGHRVHRPVLSPTAPAGWTARCADGTYSFSEHRRGTCSHHGGVRQWH